MKKTYFASDFHLGSPSYEASRIREDKIIRWLQHIEHDAATIYLLGDIFDFWHEYKTVVPKGYVRLLGKLANLSDNGIDIQLFTGNHDLWVNDYFQTELGIQLFKNPEERTINNKKFLIGHGDGLGPGDKTYKKLRKLFHNPIAQWFFRWLHPDIGMRIANSWSANSRKAHKEPEHFLGEDNEFILQYCNEYLKTKNIDFFIFGHRHLPIDFTFNETGSRYINLGEWISQHTYAVFDGQTLELEEFKG